MKHSTINSIISWTARIIGTLMVIFTLLIGIGELLEEHRGPNPGLNTFTIILFIVWGAALAGLVLALWKEGLGGIISLVAFIVFNILVAINPTPDSWYPFGLLLFLVPSILYLVYWWLERDSSNKNLDNK
jgi:peptidoglycan/LPS O-acetylase OafA/YrhL